MKAAIQEEYLIDLDVERAALTAGHSNSMARSKAYQWVRNGKIKPPKPYRRQKIQGI
jgi:phage terminase small subunit